MSTFPFVTADVFTKQRFGGNQLAVFPDALGIAPELMQQIAREFNFSETTFVLPPDDSRHTRRIRIFTPTYELPFAGHPTVGTAFALASLGEIPMNGAETRIVFEEGVGPVSVTIRAENGIPGFAQLTAAKLPEFGPPAPAAPDLAHVLGLDRSDVLDDTFAPEAVSCGVPYLCIPVRNRAVLGRARVQVEEFVSLLQGYWTAKVYLFCEDPELPGSHIRARMFAPELGIAEDPATGSAVAGLSGYLAKRSARRDGTLRWVIEQGFEMGRPSILEAEADVRDGAVAAVRVGGHSVLVTRGELTI